MEKFPSQITQRIGWMSTQMVIMQQGALENVQYLIFLPRAVNLKAIGIVIMLATTVETAIVNRTLHMICKIHLVVLGWSMKSQGQRKQEISKMSCSSECGYWPYYESIMMFHKYPRITYKTAGSDKKIKTRAIPKCPLYVRSITVL